MNLVNKLSVLLVLICINVRATILIVGPKYIQKNRDITLVISNILGETSNLCLLNLHIEGFDDDRRPIFLSSTQKVKIMGDSYGMVAFKMPNNITWGKYQIIVEGKEHFTNYTNNIYRKVEPYYDVYYKHILGLVQLNKNVITPGEILKIRVIVLDDNFKPISSEKTKVSVYVYSANQKMIRQWSNVSLHNGIFETQITISTLAVFGTYTVIAMTNGIHFGSQSFIVRNHDMHSIHISIYSSTIPLLEHQALNLTIEVNNYLRKPVRGNLTMVGASISIQSIPYTCYVNGKRHIYLPFNLKVEFPTDQHTVYLTASFTEQYTNRTFYKYAGIKMYKSKYKVSIYGRKLKYYPGSPFIVTLQVIYQNYTTAKNVTLNVAIKGVNKVYDKNCTSNMKGEINFFMHTHNSTEIERMIVYDGDRKILDEPIIKVKSAHSLEAKYIKLELLTRVKFNRMFRLLVTCSHNMTILLYYVISKENIVDAGFFRTNQMKRYTFQLLMSEKLIPVSKIIVITIVHKTLIYGKVDISINDLGNPLEIKIEENISEDGVDPGDEIELSIRGRPGAFVALAAYDQRLTQNDWNHDSFFENVWQKLYINEVTDSLNENGFSGLKEFAVVTDDTIKINDYEEYEERGIYPNDPRYGMPGPYRTDFWESWLWQNLTIPPSGRYALEVTVPHSTTSWYITGISIDPKYGLGIVKKRITFQTVKIFFILDHLPHSIKRGETLSLHFTLFSSIDEEFQANVTMFSANNQIQFIDRPADAKETKTVSVPPNSDAPVSFLVKAMKLGELEIRVNASIMKGVILDSFKKIIIVRPEDVLLQKTKRMRFDRDTPSTQSHIISFSDASGEGTLGTITGHLELFVYPDQQSLKTLQNSYNVSLQYEGFEKSLQLNLEYKENITIKFSPKNKRKINVIVSGSGPGVIRVSWQYRLNLVDLVPRFVLHMTKKTTPTEWMKELHICFRFIPKKKDNHSNGTLVEVSIPIGYAIDSHNVVEETTINPISRIEILHGGTTAMVTYSNIGNETTCFSVFVYRRYKMRVRNPSYIKVQDTYRPELSALQKFDFH